MSGVRRASPGPDRAAGTPRRLVLQGLPPGRVAVAPRGGSGGRGRPRGGRPEPTARRDLAAVDGALQALAAAHAAASGDGPLDGLAAAAVVVVRARPPHLPARAEAAVTRLQEVITGP